MPITIGGETTQSIVIAAALELGLVDAYFEGNNTNNVLLTPALNRLVQLYNSLGQDLASNYNWPQLRRQSSFIANSAGVPLPGDFDRFVDGTLFRRSTATQAFMASSEQWQALLATNAVGTIQPWVRFIEQRWVATLPSDGSTIYFEYQSYHWMTDAGHPDNSLTAYRTFNFDDSPYFDSNLLVKGLKLYHKREIGQDTTNTQRDFDEALDRAMRASTMAPVLSMTRSSGARLIDNDNVPDTGFGS